MSAAPAFDPPRLGLLDRLKGETRDLHDAIEANPRFAMLMDPALTRDAYGALLERLLAFHATADDQVGAHLGTAPGLALERRGKTAALRADLAALGRDGGAITPAPLRLANDAASAWGCLYVTEGATLGGRVILKRLTQTLGVGPASGAAYHAGYGEETGPMWQRFRAALAAHSAQRPHDDDRIIAAARSTFAALDSWVARG